MLIESNYDKEETEFLIEGLKHGFRIGYQGSQDRRDFSKNLPFRDGIGSKGELWEKMMKEVKLKRFAGPFKKEEIPFQHVVQSPIGLVPKGEDGKQTRLIFHLSYNSRMEASQSMSAHHGRHVQ